MDNEPQPDQNNALEPKVVRPSSLPQRPIDLPTLPEPQSPAPVLLGKPEDESTGVKGNIDEPSGWRELFSTIGILLTALVVALLMIMFVFRSYQVDGPSMQTTLHNADKLIIWKVPRTWARFTHHNYVPNRGDVIIFSQSGLSEFGQTDTKQLIKRVIGLPSEHVVVRDGVVTVYNAQHPGGFQPDKTLPYGNVIPNTSGDIDITLGSDQIFVCGDNRPDSLDSRAFGPIRADQIIGKLVLRVFPISQAKPF